MFYVRVKVLRQGVLRQGWCSTSGLGFYVRVLRQVAGADLGGVHDDGGDEVEEDVVAVGPDGGVVEGHLQLVHGLQQQTLRLVVEVLEGGLLQGDTPIRTRSDQDQV